MAAGKLIYLTVPIGNLDDITVRVLKSLREGKIFAVEDTRSFMHLLQLYAIDVHDKKIICWQEHSTDGTLKMIQELLHDGAEIYVVSEAGSPVISDPGFALVRQCVPHMAALDSYSGVSALIMAVELSLLPPNPLHFHGFMGKKASDWSASAEKIKQQAGAHYFFLSPHGLEKVMEGLVELLPEAEFVLLRELSKKFQEVVRFKGKDQWLQVAASLKIKGEFVLGAYDGSFAPEHKTKMDVLKLQHLAKDALVAKGRKKEVAKLIQAILGDQSVDEIYRSLM